MTKYFVHRNCQQNFLKAVEGLFQLLNLYFHHRCDSSSPNLETCGLKKMRLYATTIIVLTNLFRPAFLFDGLLFVLKFCTKIVGL